MHGFCSPQFCSLTRMTVAFFLILTERKFDGRKDFYRCWNSFLGQFFWSFWAAKFSTTMKLCHKSVSNKIKFIFYDLHKNLWININWYESREDLTTYPSLRTFKECGVYYRDIGHRWLKSSLTIHGWYGARNQCGTLHKHLFANVTVHKGIMIM